MAKLECRIHGDFQATLSRLENSIQSGSLSASYEGGSDYDTAGTRVAVRVYERYSYLGGNRVSMNLTLVGHGEELFLSVITSGGSQAVFFKLNTWGEESFLDTIRDEVTALGGRELGGQ